MRKILMRQGPAMITNVMLLIMLLAVGIYAKIDYLLF